MNLIRAFKKLILVISSTMFIYQASIAIEKLLNPPVIDSTQRFSISNIETPLITICPLNQYNYSKLQQFGYEDEIHFILGLGPNNLFIGWGKQHNLSFEQLFQHVENFNLSNPEFNIYHKNQTYEEIEYEMNFLPYFGLCYDLVNITITKEFVLDISLDEKVMKAQVFITDKNMRTRNTVDADSHWGSSIFIQQGME